MTNKYTCEACGGTFEAAWTEAEAKAEADAVYQPGELDREGAAMVCHDCWLEMRVAIPDMDARYTEQGL